MNADRFIIDPRPAELGGGYIAKIFDTDDIEIACAVFPLVEFDGTDEPDVEAYSAAYRWADEEMEYL